MPDAESHEVLRITTAVAVVRAAVSAVSKDACRAVLEINCPSDRIDLKSALLSSGM